MKSLILSLYKKNQDETSIFIREFLDKKEVPYLIDTYGNIISITHENKSCFVAHMDTVGEDDARKTLLIDRKKGILRREGGTLGADDKAGVNLILNHCKDINFIFTRDEEVGCLGAKHLNDAGSFYNLMKNYNISCLIELDRKGNNSILGQEHGYCSKDLQTELEKILPNHINDIGVLTDIDELCHKIASCNISVGYYNAHTKNEYLDIKDFNYINSKILELSNIQGKFEVNNNDYLKYWDNASSDDDIDYCWSCGALTKVESIDVLLGKSLCNDCIEELASELNYKLWR